jgi:PHD/YefM family antitoxin component YafN of YafNO toxin-antitoxin module
MSTIELSRAKSKLQRLIEDAHVSHKPVLIKGKDANAVLLSEQDWRSIQETLYLLSIPGMRQSIRRGLKTPVNKCLTKIRW